MASSEENQFAQPSATRRRIAGWRVSRTAHVIFVLDALEQALHERRPTHGGVSCITRAEAASQALWRVVDRGIVAQD
jgi:hypothetical protein